MKSRSDYSVVAVTPDKVFLVDDDLGNISVTNDAENVTKDIFTKYGQKKIVYMDSTGRWDELVHDRGRFTDFAPTNQDEVFHIQWLVGNKTIDNK